MHQHFNLLTLFCIYFVDVQSSMELLGRSKILNPSVGILILRMALHA